MTKASFIHLLCWLGHTPRQQHNFTSWLDQWEKYKYTSNIQNPFAVQTDKYHQLLNIGEHGPTTRPHFRIIITIDMNNDELCLYTHRYHHHHNPYHLNSYTDKDQTQNTSSHPFLLISLRHVISGVKWSKLTPYFVILLLLLQISSWRFHRPTSASPFPAFTRKKR